MLLAVNPLTVYIFRRKIKQSILNEVLPANKIITGSTAARISTISSSQSNNSIFCCFISYLASSAFRKSFCWNSRGNAMLPPVRIKKSFFTMSCSWYLSCYKAIANPFDSNNFQRRIFFQVAAQFSYINIQVTAVEERVIAPKQVKNIFPVNDLISVLK